MTRRLIAWTALGLAGCGLFIYAGLHDRAVLFALGITWALAATVMLGSGLFIPRRYRRRP